MTRYLRSSRIDLDKSSFVLRWPSLPSLAPRREVSTFRIFGTWKDASNFCRSSVVPLGQLLSEGDTKRVAVYLDGPLTRDELLASYEWILSLDQPGPYYISEAYNPRGEGYVHQRISFIPQSWNQLRNIVTDKRVGFGSCTSLACAFFNDGRPQDVLRCDYFAKQEFHSVLSAARYVVEYDKDFDAFVVLYIPEQVDGAGLTDAIQRSISSDIQKEGGLDVGNMGQEIPGPKRS
jgi:hypothetical protein